MKISNLQSNLLGIIVLFYSCNSAINIKNVSLINIISSDVKVQVYNINVEKDTVITSKLGIKIYIPKFCFITETGDSALSNVEFNIREVITVKDILTNDIITITDDNRFIETGGMLEVRAFFENKKLKLNNKPIKIQIPNIYQNRNRMYTFYGIEDSNSVKWHFGDSSLVNDLNIDTAKYASDTIQRGFDSILDSYLIQSNQLGWINCDRFIEFDQKEDLTVEINGVSGQIEIGCYIVFKNYKSVLSSNEMNGKNIIFNNIPSNETISIIVIGKKSNDYLYGITDANTSDKNKKIIINISSKENIETELKKLNNIWM